MKRLTLIIILLLDASFCVAGTLTFPASIKCLSFTCQICNKSNGTDCRAMPSTFTFDNMEDGTFVYIPKYGVTATQPSTGGNAFASASYQQQGGTDEPPLNTSYIIDYQKTGAQPNFYKTPWGFRCTKSQISQCVLYTVAMH